MSSDRADAVNRLVAQFPITNQCWTLEEDGRLVAEISMATLGGREIIYDPWGQPIANTTLRTTYSGEGIDREVSGWDVTIVAPGGFMVQGHLIND